MLLIKTIGEQIALLRRKRAYTQMDLADIIGVSKQTISNWENDVKTPRMGAIQKLSDHFKVPKSFIVDGSVDIDTESTTTRNIPFVKTILTEKKFFNEENITSFIPMFSKYLQEDKDYMFFEFFGEFMNLEFKEGITLLCENNHDIKSGDIALLNTKEYGILLSKVSLNEDALTLIPFSTNQGLHPITFTQKNDVTIIGKIIYSFRTF